MSSDSDRSQVHYTYKSTANLYTTVDYLIMHDIIMHICHIASIWMGTNMGGGEMGYIMHRAEARNMH